MILRNCVCKNFTKLGKQSFLNFDICLVGDIDSSALHRKRGPFESIKRIPILSNSRIPLHTLFDNIYLPQTYIIGNPGTSWDPRAKGFIAALIYTSAALSLGTSH